MVDAYWFMMVSVYLISHLYIDGISPRVLSRYPYMHCVYIVCMQNRYVHKDMLYIVCMCMYLYVCT